jgi:hypothetical protein
MPMIPKQLDFRKIARRAGMVALVLVALDLVATTATLAFGLEMFRK